MSINKMTQQQTDLRHYAMSVLHQSGLSIEDISNLFNVDKQVVRYGLKCYKQRSELYGSDYFNKHVAQHKKR